MSGAFFAWVVQLSAHRQDCSRMSFLGLRPDKDLDRKGASSGLSTGYLLPFEIVSVHLLVVLVGAAYLARAKRRQGS